MKKINMYVFVKRFNEVDELEGFKFVKTVSKNFNLFKGEVDSLDKGREANKSYKEYITKSDTLLKEYAELDDKGNPISNKLDNGRVSYNIKPDGRAELEIKLEELTVTYKEGIEAHTKAEKDFMDDLETDVDIKFATINEDDLPINITSKQILLLDEMIEWN